mmetsp:Transcript_5279/g.7820  ORF Transcript_5279/g.7820 Transcript_5279/m.7820 type:complete len:93 (-) Transcript_5279:13-291(-)
MQQARTLHLVSTHYTNQFILPSTTSASTLSPSPGGIATFGIHALMPSPPPTNISYNNLWALGHHHNRHIAPTTTNTLLQHSSNKICHPPTSL